MSYTTGLSPTGLPVADDTAPAGSVNSTTKTQAATRNSTSHIAEAADIATDSAKLSLAGAMLSEAASGSDVRFDKVAAIRQSIEGGTYSVPADAVATKLVDTLRK